MLVEDFMVLQGALDSWIIHVTMVIPASVDGFCASFDP